MHFLQEGCISQQMYNEKVFENENAWNERNFIKLFLIFRKFMNLQLSITLTFVCVIK